MIIKPSTALRNDYQTISNMVKETAEPIYITKNGEGDMVVLSIEAYERREEMLRLRERLLYSEEERLSGARTYSEEEVLQMLKDNPKTEKGEYCLVLDFHGVTLPEEKAPAADISLEAQLVDAMLQDGLDLRDAQNELVLQGAKKNAVKQAALRLKKLFMEEDA